MTIADAVVDRLPIAVYAIDDDRFVDVNTKFAETLGYTKQEILDPPVRCRHHPRRPEETFHDAAIAERTECT